MTTAVTIALCERLARVRQQWGLSLTDRLLAISYSKKVCRTLIPAAGPHRSTDCSLLRHGRPRDLTTVQRKGAGRRHTFLIAESRIALKACRTPGRTLAGHTYKLWFFEMDRRFTRLYSGLPCRRPLPSEGTGAELDEGLPPR